MYLHSEFAEKLIAMYTITQVFLQQNPPRDKSVPGPGEYKVINDPGKEAVKFSMRPKTTNPSKLINRFKHF